MGSILNFAVVDIQEQETAHVHGRVKKSLVGYVDTPDRKYQWKFRCPNGLHEQCQPGNRCACQYSFMRVRMRMSLDSHNSWFIRRHKHR